MKMTKLVLLIGAIALALFLILPNLSWAADDGAAIYKSKCAMCHGQTAEKKFDATKADDDLIQIVLNGKQAEKPPNMPKFADRGITADQAKALVGFMKSQKH